MKKFLSFLFSSLILVSAFSQTPKIQASIKPGSADNKVKVTIRPTADLLGAKFSSFQFTLAVPSSFSPVPVPTVTSLLPRIGYAPYQVTENVIIDGSSFTIYSFSGDGSQGDPVENYISGNEYDIAEVAFNIANVTADFRIVQIPNGGANFQNNFYVADKGLDVTNTTAQFYAADPTKVSNDGLGYAGTSWAMLDFAPTPVRLSGFTVNKKNNDVLLSWELEAGCYNCNYFEIERSFTGMDFVNTGRVNVPSLTHRNFSYIDVNALSQRQNSVIYYRLKMVDNDGRHVYSDIKNVMMKSRGFAINLYPNPATDFTKISMELANAAHVKIKVSNAEGKELKQLEFQGVKGLNQKTINLSTLSAGTYLVKVFTGDQQMTIPFIKN